MRSISWPAMCTQSVSRLLAPGCHVGAAASRARMRCAFAASIAACTVALATQPVTYLRSTAHERKRAACMHTRTV